MILLQHMLRNRFSLAFFLRGYILPVLPDHHPGLLLHSLTFFLFFLYLQADLDLPVQVVGGFGAHVIVCLADGLVLEAHAGHHAIEERVRALFHLHLACSVRSNAWVTLLQLLIQFHLHGLLSVLMH